MSTSIIVPCRNEAGSIESLLSSILPILGPKDELIIVEGGSYDATWQVVKKFASVHTGVSILQQNGKGKFNAVLNGIEIAKCEYVMIWDADGTVAFADNLKIFHLKIEEPYIATGDRLRGTREANAMQAANFVGNWLFAILWGLLLSRPPFDTLCGTKKFPTKLFKESPNWLTSSDPYGDFSILAMSRIKRIKVISIPVQYSARKYGQTNIHRWSGGLLLLKFVVKVVLKGR